ncbi:MAG: AAA family ATPase, partial [Proteobacteria bacterium]|nr:AAA family ATPase [Pseudomonadota bacterium]
ANEGVILIAATNRPDVLDPALLRPGRFDRQVVVPNPDILGRERILKVHMRQVALGSDVVARTIARGTPGFSGADLANLVNEAALLAARKGKRVVTMEDFEESKDKVMMGAERRSMVMSDEEKKLTAYHEAGHALVTVNCPASDPIHKATIIPRGQSLGLVQRLPLEDRHSQAVDYLEEALAIAMGGRVAEELVFGKRKVTTGCSSDIKMATSLARQMVTEWGMSEKLGPLRFNDNEEEIFLGHSVTQRKNVSEATAQMIDEEVRRLVEEANATAHKIISEGIDQLHILAKALLEYETLSGDDIAALLRGESLHRPEEVDQPPEADDQKGTRSPIPSTGQSKAAGKGKPGLSPEPQPGS